MKATKKRPSRAKQLTRTSDHATENTSTLAQWGKATAHGCLISLAATAVLSALAAGIAYATDQIIDLYANGIKNVHVYTMNNPDVAEKIMANLSDILGK